MQLREFRSKIVVSPLADAVTFIYDLAYNILREGFARENQIMKFRRDGHFRADEDDTILVLTDVLQINYKLLSLIQEETYLEQLFRIFTRGSDSYGGHSLLSKAGSLRLHQGCERANNQDYFLAVLFGVPRSPLVKKRVPIS
jgi:hypothetical protein